MQNEPIMMLPLTLADFKNEMRDLIAEGVAQAVKHSKKHAEQEKYLSAQEAADFLKIGITTLRNATKTGIFIGHRAGARVLYKPSELTAALRRTDQFKVGGAKRGPKPKNQANA